MKKKDIKVINNVINKIAMLEDNLNEEKVREARIEYNLLTDDQKLNVTNLNILIKCEEELKALLESPKVKEEKLVAYSIDLQLIATHHLVCKTEYEINIKEESINLCDTIIKNNQFVTKMNLLEDAKQFLINYKRELEYKKQASIIDERIIEIRNASLDNSSLILEIAEEIKDKDYIIKYMMKYELLISYLNELEYLNRANYLDELIISYKDITIEDEKSLLELEEMVNNESSEVKSRMKQINQLRNKIDELNELKRILNNSMLAKSIDKQIELLNITLNDDITYENKRLTYDITQNLIKSIDNEVYSLLTNKELLKELDLLMLKINKKQDEILKANKVIEKINEIPSTITLDLADMISDVRIEYEALTMSERELVYNYDLLVNVEQALYENESAYLVIKEINSLNNITLNDERLIKEINIMYDELSNEEKQLVSNYDILFKANKELKKLKKTKALADSLYNEINNVDLDMNKLLELRNKFNSLPEEYKKYVSNINKLNDLEDEVKAINEASLLDEEINDLPYNITYEYSDEVNLLNNSYNNLSIKAKSYVKNYSILQDNINKIKSYELKINEIIDEICKIGEVDITEGDEIASVKMKYNLLDNSLKKYITNYDKLCKQEREFMRLHEENKTYNSYIDEQITLLLDLSKLIDEEKLAELKRKILNDYEKLDGDEKKLVKKIDLLTNL